jgi:hypothetical protein
MIYENGKIIIDIILHTGLVNHYLEQVQYPLKIQRRVSYLGIEVESSL